MSVGESQLVNLYGRDGGVFVVADNYQKRAEVWKLKRVQMLRRPSLHRIIVECWDIMREDLFKLLCRTYTCFKLAQSEAKAHYIVVMRYNVLVSRTNKWAPINQFTMINLWSELISLELDDSIHYYAEIHYYCSQESTCLATMRNMLFWIVAKV